MRERFRFGVLTTFTLVSLLIFAVLGLALVRVAGEQVRSDALAHATRDADLLVDTAIEPRLTFAHGREALSAASVRELDRALVYEYQQQRILQIHVWSRSGRVLYSGGPAARRFPVVDAAVRAALRGRGQSDHEALAAGPGQIDAFETHVPVQGERAGLPASAVELYQPYAPIAATITRNTHSLVLLIAGGLLLLYLALLPIVASASRRISRQTKQLEHKALHDELTGLPNRLLLHRLIEKARVHAGDGEGMIAVMLLDLDRFKDVNDALGHRTGDLLLCQLGGRLRSALGSAGTVARLGGDEFAILLPSISGPAQAIATAERIGQALDESLSVEGMELAVEGSIGIAVAAAADADEEKLLARADVAMYRAKRTGRPYDLSAPADDEVGESRLALLADLRPAIERHELVVHYQPVVEIPTGHVHGVEALVRWQHPQRGLVSPDQFIELAEQSSLIAPLTRFVLETALRQCAAWEAAGHELTVAVNLSTRNLHDRALVDDVRQLLTATHVPAHRLTLEVTETAMLAEPAIALETMDRLAELGVGLAIDDFGTGYSSLAALRQLPVNQLKIDRSFVMEMSTSPDDDAIVSSAVTLGRSHGLVVVAEGVETEQAWRQLAELGCHLAQGYHISRPLPEPEITRWLQAREALARQIELLAQV